jgi:hypothetical protein
MIAALSKISSTQHTYNKYFYGRLNINNLDVVVKSKDITKARIIMANKY